MLTHTPLIIWGVRGKNTENDYSIKIMCALCATHFFSMEEVKEDTSYQKIHN